MNKIKVEDDSLKKVFNTERIEAKSQTIDMLRLRREELVDLVLTVRMQIAAIDDEIMQREMNK